MRIKLHNKKYDFKGYHTSISFGNKSSEENIFSRFKYLSYVKALFFLMMGEKFTYWFRWGKHR